jgi:hypothetical protein
MGDDVWSVRRLANRCGVREAALARDLAELEAAGVYLREWQLDRAVIAVGAYRGGHGPHAIATLGQVPFLGSTAWLASTDNTTDAHVFSTLLHATTYIADHPSSTWHLSPVGLMGLEVTA